MVFGNFLFDMWLRFYFIWFFFCRVLLFCILRNCFFCVYKWCLIYEFLGVGYIMWVNGVDGSGIGGELRVMGRLKL